MWHFLLKAMLTWCALSALLVFCWIAVKEISRQVASRGRRRSERTEQSPQRKLNARAKTDRVPKQRTMQERRIQQRRMQGLWETDAGPPTLRSVSRLRVRLGKLAALRCSGKGHPTPRPPRKLHSGEQSSARVSPPLSGGGRNSLLVLLAGTSWVRVICGGRETGPA